MSRPNDVLAGIAQALALADQGRLVTRKYMEFDARDQASLLRGVWTLLSRGLREENGLWVMDLLLVGQLTVREGADVPAMALSVEQAELEMIEGLLCLIGGIRGCGLQLRGLRQSMQLEAPDGWVAADLEAGPFGLDETIPEISFAGVMA